VSFIEKPVFAYRSGSILLATPKGKVFRFQVLIKKLFWESTLADHGANGSDWDGFSRMLDDAVCELASRYLAWLPRLEMKVKPLEVRMLIKAEEESRRAMSR
jgi:hypothetical protein